MNIVVGIMAIVIILLFMYIIYLQLQLRSINRQLNKRLAENTRQPISLQLLNRELNDLAININRCLKAEELLRLNSIQDEKRFKELIANISHDLRTPLTAIKGYQQLMEHGELTEDQFKKLLVAKKHVEELGRLIDQFFEYSYLNDAKPEVKMERINLTNLVTETLLESIRNFEEHNISVKFEETTPIYVLADQGMILRIIKNLIRNCIQHSNGDIEVGLCVKEEVVLTFKNPVKNRSEIDVERLFERFYTGDKARNNSTGLGLSIVKLLAEQMGGRTSATWEDGLLTIQVSLQLFQS